MSLTKQIGYGTTLQVDPTNGSTFSTTLNVVDSIAGPDAKAHDVRTTVLANFYDTYACAGVDGGTVTLNIAYDPQDGTTNTVSAMLSTGALAAWKITFPSGGTETFHGYLAGMSRPIKRDNLIMADLTIRTSGNPGFVGA